MAKQLNIKAAIKHPGALHKALGVAKGKTIPQKAVAKAATGSMGAKVQREAQFAQTLARLRGGK